MNDNEYPNQTEHERERLRDLLPGYALGFADESDIRQVEQLLAKFPGEAAALDDYAALSDAMLHSAPPLAPPAKLLGTLMQAVGERENQKPESSAKIIAPRFNRTLVAIAAAVVLLLALNLFTLMQFMDLRSDQNILQAQTDTQQQMLAMIARDDVTRFTIEDVRQPDDPLRLTYGEAVAYVVCNPQKTIGIFYAENLPPLDQDHAYQIWLVKGETRVSGGLVRPATDGTVTYVFSAPENMHNYQYVGITPEPASGSSGPTGDPVVRGKLYDNPESGANW